MCDPISHCCDSHGRYKYKSKSYSSHSSGCTCRYDGACVSCDLCDAAAAGVGGTGGCTRGCFAGTARVEIAGGANVTMDQLRIGDRVRVGTDARGAPLLEPIYSWTGESDPAKRGLMAHVALDSGATLVLTGTHWLIVEGGGHREARDVRPGDRLVLAGGGSAVVTGNAVGLARGSYHPVTPSGRIVVEGVLATTYDSGACNGGAGVPAWAIHAAVTPARLIARAVPEGWWRTMEEKVEPAILWAIYAPGRWLVRFGFGFETLASVLPAWAGTAAVAATTLACAVPVSRAMRA